MNLEEKRSRGKMSTKEESEDRSTVYEYMLKAESKLMKKVLVV